MNFSSNKTKFLENENIPIYGLLLTYLFIWLISNNAFAYHRDEMWYTMYSIFFTDKTTNDIRHVTQNDIHQIAFLPAFRYIHGFFVNMFGQNIYSLRITNIFFALVALFFTLKTMKRYKFSFVYLLLFTLLISFDNQIIIYSHKARPDFSVSMLSLASIILILDFLKNKELIKLFISGIFAVLASSFYWNGLAVLVAYGVTIILLLNFKKILFKQFVYLSIFLLILFMLIVGLPIFQKFELFKEVFTNQTTLESINFFNGLNIFLMFKNSITGGIYQLLIALLFIIIIYSLTLNFFNHKPNADSFFYILVFITVILIVSSLRASSARHLYIFLPLIYLATIFSINNISKDLKTNKLVLLSVIGIILVLNLGKSLINFKQNYGQVKAYDLYADKINNIAKSEGYVLARYNMAWAINNPKFYISNFSFKTFKNQNDFDELMSKYDLKYLLIDEPTRERMDDPKERKVWYKFFKNYMEDNFEIKETFYNKFYIKNKSYKYQYQEGYKNEIWIRK
ncbi:glycosyltransferase family 39 protein [Candidatus Pelagibacter ubique]|nr:glycosyltransferase family 39 protein [Candidatus Pelagibacter ubique]